MSLAVKTPKWMVTSPGQSGQTSVNIASKSGYVGEPAVGFEPTACCLRNTGDPFRPIPLRPMRTPRALILANSPLHASRSVPFDQRVLLAVLLARL